jgi:hypothetical protein
MAMPGDPRADAIFEEIERLMEELKAAVRNKDAAAQRLIITKLARSQLGLRRIEIAHRVILAGIMASVREATNPQDRVQELLNAFRYVSFLLATAQYDLVDDDLSGDAETHLRTILSGLDAIEPEGRMALVPFLDSHDLDARACAAVALLELIPDRAIPVLRDLVENSADSNAAITAFEALQKRR